MQVEVGRGELLGDMVQTTAVRLGGEFRRSNDFSGAPFRRPFGAELLAGLANHDQSQQFPEFIPAQIRGERAGFQPLPEADPGALNRVVGVRHSNAPARQGPRRQRRQPWQVSVPEPQPRLRVPFAKVLKQHRHRPENFGAVLRGIGGHSPSISRR